MELTSSARSRLIMVGSSAGEDAMSTPHRLMASLCVSGTVRAALTRPLSYSPQMTIVAPESRPASRAISSLSISSGHSTVLTPTSPGFQYMPVYLGLDATPYVEPLLPTCVVDEGRNYYE